MEVDTVLTRLEALIRDARAVPMSASCMVHRDDVLDLIEDARRSLPSQLGDAQTVLTQRDAVVAEARDQSKAIIDSAYAEASLGSTSLRRSTHGWRRATPGRHR